MKNSTAVMTLCLGFVLASTVCALDDSIPDGHRNDAGVGPPPSRPLSPASVIKPVSADAQQFDVVPPDVPPPANGVSTEPNAGIDNHAGLVRIANILEPVTAHPKSPALTRPYGVPSEYSEYQSTYFNSGIMHFGCYGQHYGYAGRGGTYCHGNGCTGCDSACLSHGGSHFTKQQQRHAAARSAAISRMSPLGSSINALMGAQVSNANAAQLMLYNYDFVAQRSELTVRGVRELHNMAAALNNGGNVILVEATPYTPELAKMRRETVLVLLSSLLPEMSMEERVLVSEPLSRGLDGPDALSVSSQLQELQSGTGGQQGGAITPSQPASLR